MLYNAFICFHMLSYASKSFYNKSLYMLLYPFIRFHALSYAFIHFRMLSYAFICFTMLLYAMEATCLLYKHKVSLEADHGSRVYRLYLRKPVKKDNTSCQWRTLSNSGANARPQIKLVASATRVSCSGQVLDRHDI